MSTEEVFRSQYKYGAQSPVNFNGPKSDLATVEEAVEEAEWKRLFSVAGSEARRNSDPSIRRSIAQHLDSKTLLDVNRKNVIRRRTSAPHAMPKPTDAAFTSNSGDSFDIPRITFIGKVRRAMDSVLKRNRSLRRVFPATPPPSRGGDMF